MPILLLDQGRPLPVLSIGRFHQLPATSVESQHYQWAYWNKVELDFSRPGKPTDDAFIESFNSRLRQECLNENWFLSLVDAKQKIEAWRHHYYEARPHGSLGNLAPSEFAPNGQKTKTKNDSKIRTMIGTEKGKTPPSPNHKILGGSVLEGKVSMEITTTKAETAKSPLRTACYRKFRHSQFCAGLPAPTFRPA